MNSLPLTRCFACVPAVLGAAALLLSSLSVAQTAETPEAATGFAPRPAVYAKRFIAATANRHATNAAYEMLKIGGSAVDAAIAAQLVLGLTEPHSSGLGGGAFVLLYERDSGAIRAYDGREAAPASARPDRFMGADGKPLTYPEAVGGGLSVGVPGAMRALELAHRRHGRLPWARLFAPAITIAESGFAVSPRLSALVARDPLLRRNAAARSYFHSASGEALAAGTVLRNPAYAATLRTLAREGAGALYRGEIARDILAAVNGHQRPGNMSEADLAGYEAKERTPVCGSYRGKRICGMPPPSAGGIAVLAILRMLERFDLASLRPDSTAAAHLFAEAGSLAFADRDHYIGDPDQVRVPVSGLIDRNYLNARSQLIRPGQSMGRAAPGAPPGADTAFGADATVEAAGTSHLSIVDAEGNAVAMTTTIESAFGSRIMVRGFMLNNQLTDFSWFQDAARSGAPAANSVGAGKRPRSAMAPTLVFESEAADAKLEFVLGSPGGPSIINYVARALVALIDWKLPIADVFAMPHVGSRNTGIEVEKGTAAERLLLPLRALGHRADAVTLPSGYTGIAVTAQGMVGAVDPRREGTAKGE